jgi:hypothetical protein
MSSILPKETVNAFRRSQNTILKSIGIEVTLYVPMNAMNLEGLEVFKTTEDRMYKKFSVMAFINWSPNSAQLKKLNLFSEEDLPILCHLPNDIAKEIQVDSYISVPIEHVPTNYTVTEFDIVNKKIPNMHDAVVFPVYLLAPRRI